LALTSPTGGGRSVGIVRVRTKATEFSFYIVLDQSHKERQSRTEILDRSTEHGQMHRKTYCVRCAGSEAPSQPARRTVSYREHYIRCCINTVRPPDDEQSVARNNNNKSFIQRNCASNWSFTQSSSNLFACGLSIPFINRTNPSGKYTYQLPKNYKDLHF